ncbi:hypothetical protein Tsubulata_040436 [Turnera subulata]|uniref:RRM domain-containing protein n=1 Tax=Turnera subulata TaxID=218843 RepID=A0A9Q0FLM6_9ROSI|nr:hypothetical protein Tsubulata_040436 [Turnera subulata]
MENNQLVSIYIENLPQRWTITDIILVLSKFGVVMDVFIPNKTSVRGARFGFVRFENNGNINSLVDNINSVVVDNQYLKANVARCRSTNGSGNRKQAMKNGFIPNMVHHSVGRSFSQILGVSPDKSVAGSSNPIVDGANIIYNSGMESIQRMRSCAFGILRKPMALQEVQGLFCVENKLGVVVKPMGGKSVLVCMESGEAVNSFLKAQYP